ARGREPSFGVDRGRAHGESGRAIGRGSTGNLRRVQPGRRHRAGRHARRSAHRSLCAPRSAARQGPPGRMKTWLRQHRQAIAAALRKFAAQKSAAMLNALVIGIALSLPAGGYALLSSLRDVTLGAALEPQLSVFLRADATRAAAEALGARLKSDARLGDVRFVSREQALKELQATEGLAEVAAALGRNPLPDAFVVRPKLTDSAEAAQLDALAQELRAVPGVAHVQV